MDICYFFFVIFFCRLSVVTEEIGRLSHLSGVHPQRLAIAFQQQAHI